MSTTHLHTDQPRQEDSHTICPAPTLLQAQPSYPAHVRRHETQSTPQHLECLSPKKASQANPPITQSQGRVRGPKSSSNPTCAYPHHAARLDTGDVRPRPCNATLHLSLPPSDEERDRSPQTQNQGPLPADEQGLLAHTHKYFYSLSLSLFLSNNHPNPPPPPNKLLLRLLPSPGLSDTQTYCFKEPFRHRFPDSKCLS